MQGSSANGSASQLDGLEFSHRGNGPRFADLRRNIEELRYGFVLFYLVGDHPTRAFGGRTESFPLFERIDFYD